MLAVNCVDRLIVTVSHQYTVLAFCASVSRDCDLFYFYSMYVSVYGKMKDNWTGFFSHQCWQFKTLYYEIFCGLWGCLVNKCPAEVDSFQSCVVFSVFFFIIGINTVVWRVVYYIKFSNDLLSYICFVYIFCVFVHVDLASGCLKEMCRIVIKLYLERAVLFYWGNYF